MHAAAVHLAPVLAAEKSKTAFYIAGGILVAWALLLSLGIGLRRPSFPRDLPTERIVIAISVVLVLGAVGSAVVTAGTPEKTEAALGVNKKAQPAPSPSGGAAPPSGGAAPSSTGTQAAPPAAGAGGSVKIAADASGQLKFDTTTLSTKAGAVTIQFNNTSPLEHNVTIAQGTKVLGATPSFIGGSKTLNVNLAAGTYTFYCSVPGHRQAGMEGTLKVS